jgi:hypothetical protein
MSKPLTAGDRAERGREWIISSRTLVIRAQQVGALYADLRTR